MMNRPSATEPATTALLLTLCRARLTAEEQARARALLQEGIDWQRLAELACLHEVVALVRHNLLALGENGSRSNANAWQTIQQAANQIVFDSMLRMRQAGQVVQAMQAAGLDLVVLKGYALADMLYSDPVMRPSGDLDLLVTRSELPAACAVLVEGLGFPAPPQELVAFHLAHGYHLPMTGRMAPGEPLLVELHWDLAPRQLTPLDMNTLRARAQPFRLGSATAQRFSPEDALLHLALHMRKHRYVGLRWLCDLAELARRYGDQLDWEYVVASARAGGMAALLYTSLSAAQRWLDAPVDAHWLAQVRPAALHLRLLQAVLPQDPLDVPLESDREGWTRLAPAEVLLLDRPGAMLREARYRLLPPAEGAPSSQVVAHKSSGQRLAFNARRLAQRGAALLRR